MLKLYKVLNMVFAGVMTIFFSIFYVFIPYTVEQNPTVTVIELQAQALAVPIAGLFFEPIIMFLMLFAMWILGIIILAKKEGVKKTKTITENY